MKKIMLPMSQWAKMNPWPARILIFCAHVCLFVMAWYLGNMLHELGLTMPSYWLTGSMVCAAIIFFFYPYRHRMAHEVRRKFYFKQKRFDIALLSVGFFMLLLICNRQFKDIIQVSNVFAITRHFEQFRPALDSSAVSELTSMSSMQSAAPTHELTKKEKKQLLKEKIRSIKKNDEIGSGEKAILIVLVLLMSAGIIIGAASWSCTLSCSGYETAASFVMIGGLALAIFLAVFLIRQITRGNKRQQPIMS